MLKIRLKRTGRKGMNIRKQRYKSIPVFIPLVISLSAGL